jgi:homoserine O-acetyltransferase
LRFAATLSPWSALVTSIPSPSQPPRVAQRLTLPPLALDSGRLLPAATLAFHLDGALSARRDNVVLVLHALTGSADAAGDWWAAQIGPGRAIDTARWAVLAPNLLGSCYGSSGPSTVADFPALTVRDQARAVAVLLEQLGIASVPLVVGGSLGGMVALEFAASFPGRAAAALVFAAPAQLGAGAIAWSAVQRRALALGGADGLALAREIAMLSYRTANGLDARFGREREPEGRFRVQRWLTRHGEGLAARMDAATYAGLLDVMDSHDLAGARGGAAERLRASGTRLTGVGIPGDLFCDAAEVRAWVRAAGATYRELVSPHGHDAFLLEHAQVSALLAEALQPAVTTGVAA